MVGTIGLAGDMWFEAFAMPWLAQAAPVIIGVPASGSLLRAAWLVSVVGIWLARKDPTVQRTEAPLHRAPTPVPQHP